MWGRHPLDRVCVCVCVCVCEREREYVRLCRQKSCEYACGYVWVCMFVRVSAHTHMSTRGCACEWV